MESLELDAVVSLVRPSKVKNTLVSVIIPFFNDGKYLKECVTSVLKQDFSEFEVILLDNGSTDNTSELMSSYDDPKISIFRTKKNITAAKALSFMAEKAQGKYIKVFCADDIMYANCLSQLFKKAESFSASITYSMMNTMREDSRINKADMLGDIELSSSGKFFKHCLTSRNPIGFPSVLVLKSELNNSIMDFRFASLFDLNLWSQILSRPETTIAWVSEPLVAYRLRKSGGNYSSFRSAGRRNQIFIETLLWMRLTFKSLSNEKLRELCAEIIDTPLEGPFTNKELKYKIAKNILGNKLYLNHFSIDAHQIFFSEILLSSANFDEPYFDRHLELAPFYNGLKVKMTKKYINLLIYYYKKIGLLGTIRKSFHFLVR